jgi:amino acid adenylation domain-containing protein/FkbH-like protein
MISQYQPLSLPQRDIYFEELLLGNAASYNIGAKIYVNGKLDLGMLNEAYNQVIRESDALRMLIIARNGEPFVKIIEEYYHTPEFADFRNTKNPRKSAETFIYERFKKTFDLKTDEPPHKFIVARIADDQYCILSMYHHIIVDGWGTSLIYKRWTEVYNMLVAGYQIEEPNRLFSYTSFITENLKYLQSVQIKQDKQYWSDAFTDLPQPLCHLYEHRKQAAENSSITKTFAIDRGIYNDLKPIAQKEKVSVFHLLTAAIAYYFGSVMRSRDLIIGLPILNRSDFAAKKTVGLYTGINPLRVRMEGNDTMPDLMQQIRKKLRISYRHQKYPLGRILQDVRLLEQERNLLHDIFFSYEKHDYSFRFTGSECRIQTIPNPYNRTPITIYVREYTPEKDVFIDVVCNTNHVPVEIAEGLEDHYKTLFSNLLDDHNLPLKAINYLPEEEAKVIIKKLGNEQSKNDAQPSFLEMFNLAALDQPDKIAVSFGSQHISYKELQNISDRVSNYFIKTHHIGKGDVIAMYISRSEWLLPLILGVMKSGAAWLPVDLKAPLNRLATILEDSGAKLCMTDQEIVLAEGLPGKVLSLQNEQKVINSFEKQAAQMYPLSQDLAYIIYTSGTTGNPKGVEIQHKALNNLLQSMANQPGLLREDKLLAATSNAFDISILEMLLPLRQGASLVLASDQEAADPILLNELFTKLNPTVMQATPSMWSLLIESGWTGCPDLKTLSGGERLPKTLAVALSTRCGSLWNMFGPTETCIWSTITEITGDRVSIGKPISNTYIYILGQDQELLPLGATGELYIGGIGLARGYRNRPELTDQKFMPDPYRKGNLIYKTGDLCYWKNNALHYVQRIDMQVKIRGHRIECSEIENTLLRHDYVSQAVVLAVRQPTGDDTLVAYIVPSQGQTRHDLTACLANFLPQYMIPSFFVELDSIPLTISGKADAHALRKLPLSFDKNSRTRENKIDEPKLAELHQIWKEGLGVKDLSPDDNFFALGGDSLKAVKILSRVRQQLQTSLDLKYLFSHPTLKKFYENISEGHDSRHEEIKAVPEAPYHPLSPAQKRIWILSQINDGSQEYTMKEAFKVQGQIDVEALHSSIEKLLLGNSILRTAFEVRNGEPVQVILPEVDVSKSVELIKLCHASDKMEKISKIIADQQDKSFELSRPPLFKILLIQTETFEFIIHVAIHHIVADGWSLNLLIDQLTEYYRSAAHGEELPLLKMPEYKDYTVWSNERQETEHTIRQKAFWLEQLQPRVPVFNFPYDRSPHGVRTERSGSILDFNINLTLSRELYKIATQRHTTVHTVLLGIYTSLMHKFTQQEKLVVGVATAGRKHRRLEEMIGMFVNFLPLVSETVEEDTLDAHIIATGERMLRLSENELFPVETIIDELNFEDQRRPQLYSTSFIYHTEKSFYLLKKKLHPDLHVKPFYFAKKHATADFKLDIFETAPNGRLHGALEYDTELIDKRNADLIADAFVRLIQSYVEAPDKKMVEAGLFTPEEEVCLAARRQRQKPQEKAHEFNIIASFTAEPLKPYLLACADNFSINIRPTFAPYHQVIQSLLKITGGAKDVSTKTFNLLLVRFEDYILNHTGTEEEKIAVMNGALEDLRQVLQSGIADSGIWLAAILPPNENAHFTRVREALISLNKAYRKLLKSLPFIQVIDLTAVDYYYQFDKVFDVVRNKMAHIPYSEEFFAAASQSITRRLYAYNAQPAKIIAVDCDNTLWLGVCAEVGPAQVKIEEPHIILQQYLVEKYNEGYLIILVSKNHEQDVWEVFDLHPEMPLKKELISAWRINWQPKSQNLTDIARELNLSTASMIFIDDNPVECLEVLSNTPDILALRFINDADLVRHMLFHNIMMDKWNLTSEDLFRNQLYKAEKSRKNESENATSVEKFLSKLNLKVSMTLLSDKESERVSQLTFRTNQFNASQKRRTPEEIKNLDKEGKECWVIKARDNYGDYGVIGVLIIEIKDQVIDIDTFLLSCRALGREIEEAVISGLGQLAGEEEVKQINLSFNATERNAPARQFFDKYFKAEQIGGNRILYFLNIEAVPEAKYVMLYFRQPIPGASTPVPATSNIINSGFVQEEVNKKSSGKRVDLQEVVFIDQINGGNTHFLTYLHFGYTTAAAIMDLIYSEKEGSYIYGSDNPVRSILENLFAKILKKPIINANDDFFSLGGHSLGATNLLSEIYRTFHVEVSLTDFFKQPTLNGLNELVQQSASPSIKAIEEASSGPYELSGSQKRIWLLSQMRGGNIAYNLPSLLELKGEYDIHLLEKSIESIVQKHESLRTRFISSEDALFPEQEALPAEKLDYSLVQLESSSKQDRDELVVQLLQRPFDLRKDTLFRIYLLSTGEENTVILFVIHHIIADGWSLRIIADEFILNYRRLLKSEMFTVEPLKFQYRHFVEWEKRLTEHPGYQISKKYWQEKFTETQNTTTYLKKPLPPGKKSFEGGAYIVNDFSLENTTIFQLGKEKSVSTFVYLLTGVKSFLSQYLSQAEITVGTVIAGRDRWEFLEQTGVFVNTLLLKTNIDNQKSFNRQLTVVRKTVTDAYANQYYSYYDLVDDMRASGERNIPGLHVMVIFNEFALSDIQVCDNLSISIKRADELHTRFDFCFTFDKSEGGLALIINYNESLFKAEEVAQIATEFTEFIRWSMDMPDEPIKSFTLRQNNKDTEIDELNSFSF